MANKKYAWIFQLQNLVGTTVGIIMIAIGLSLTLNAAAKIYIFHYETSSYFSAEDQCQFQQPEVFLENTPPKALPKEEKEKCMTDAITQEKKRYKREKIENIIDGIILIIIGTPLWFFHRRKQ